jgi:hypothetical protein
VIDSPEIIIASSSSPHHLAVLLPGEVASLVSHHGAISAVDVVCRPDGPAPEVDLDARTFTARTTGHYFLRCTCARFGQPIEVRVYVASPTLVEHVEGCGASSAASRSPRLLAASWRTSSRTRSASTDRAHRSAASGWPTMASRLHSGRRREGVPVVLGTAPLSSHAGRASVNGALLLADARPRGSSTAVSHHPNTR